MTKKLIALVGAGAVLLSMAAPVMAVPHHYYWWGGEKNVTVVDNYAGAVANTGGNVGNSVMVKKAGVHWGFVGAFGTNSIGTGTANAVASATVNANNSDTCTWCDWGWGSEVNVTRVDNLAYADANTGNNAGNAVSVEKAHVCGGVLARGDNVIRTGAAVSRAYAVVNANIYR